MKLSELAEEVEELMDAVGAPIKGYKVIPASSEKPSIEIITTQKGLEKLTDSLLVPAWQKIGKFNPTGFKMREYHGFTGNELDSFYLSAYSEEYLHLFNQNN